MKNVLGITKLSLLFFAFSLNSLAHKLPPEVQKIVTEALDLEADQRVGKTTYKQRCAACHGSRGVPSNSKESVIPFLSGQTPVYLLIHMAMFKTKKRINPTMNAIASSLSTQDIANIEAYLVSDNAQAAHCEDNSGGTSLNSSTSRLSEEANRKIKEINSLNANIEEGRVLAARKREFTRGDGSIVGISCTMCHGDNGLMPESQRSKTKHPDLAGLGKKYLVRQFVTFQTNERLNAGPMNVMVRDLENKDIANLAAYYSSLTHCK